MEGGHDAALADDVGGAGDAGAGRGEAQNVPITFDLNEVRKPGMSAWYGIDRINPPPQQLREVGLDAHARCEVSHRAPTMRRSPSARTTLTLV